MSERRKERRKRTYLGAQVVFNRRLNIYDCLIENMSDGGAKLVFAYPATIPSAFELLVRQRGESRRASVKWRSKLAAGVGFEDDTASPYVSLEATRRIRGLEAERDALKARIAELSEP